MDGIDTAPGGGCEHRIIFDRDTQNKIVRVAVRSAGSDQESAFFALVRPTDSHVFASFISSKTSHETSSDHSTEPLLQTLKTKSVRQRKRGSNASAFIIEILSCQLFSIQHWHT